MSARLAIRALLWLPPVSIGSAALGQAVDDNVVSASEDAFGKSVGTQTSGLYSDEDVRGFSAVDAGNVRLEGLYFDLIDRFPRRLIDSSSIRIGLAAQGNPFPAPTGLADYRLNIPGEERVVSLSLDTAGNSTRGPGGILEFSLPIGSNLGLAGGVGGRNSTRNEGGKHTIRDYGILAAFRPAPGAEIILFTGGVIRLGAEATATYFPLGNTLPPRIKRGRFLGQKWTGQDRRVYVHGGLMQLSRGGWKFEAGLYQSRRTFEIDFSDLSLGVTSDGAVASRVVIAEPDKLDNSFSGEMRLTREWTTGAFAHTLTASLRGRKKHRHFGGSDRISLGPSTMLDADFRPRPDFTFGVQSTDRVRQLTSGIAYSALWQSRANLDASLSKSTYRKVVDFANAGVANSVTHDRPWLWSIAAALHLNRNIKVFGSITQGQEEALIAPAIAVNRSEAPPAIRTRQKEVGVAVALSEKLSFVAGAFTISKPYFNLDPNRIYRQLGTLTNRGIELSLAGEIVPGLSVIAGTILLDPSIRGEASDSGLIGRRPVGQLKRRTILNVDWRTGGGEGQWSFDLALESLSSRMANAANSLRAPAHEIVDIGGRYRFSLSKTQLVLRPQIRNLFNSFGWEVSSSGGFTYTRRRTAMLELVADFH